MCRLYSLFPVLRFVTIHSSHRRRARAARRADNDDFPCGVGTGTMLLRMLQRRTSKLRGSMSGMSSGTGDGGAAAARDSSSEQAKA